MGQPAVEISREKPLKPVPNHKHDDVEEQFVNRPDIKFMRCSKCGRETYPPGFVVVGDGGTVTISWPV